MTTPEPQRKYNQSEAGKAARKRYRESEKGKEAMRRKQRAQERKLVRYGGCDQCGRENVYLKRQTSPTVCDACYKREWRKTRKPDK